MSTIPWWLLSLQIVAVSLENPQGRKWKDVKYPLTHHHISDWFFQDLQDTSEYVRQELKLLEEQQKALDKVGEKLEIELRRAMECKGTVDWIS